VATAVQTAPLVAKVAGQRNIRGAYFLQHFEDWSAPRDYVEATWRLPLTRIVIAPWLREKGDALGIATILVPNAIDPSDMPAGPPIADRRTHVIALVSETPWKRTDLVVSLMCQMETAIPEFKGVTFGRCARPTGLPDSVTHYDNPDREILRKLYQSSRVYVCASDHEGWHLPPAEAMASGAAVVSTDIGGVRAYAASTAEFAPVGDGDALTELATRLVRDPAACQSRASSGQARILGYGPEDAAAAFANALLSD
jgi:glycosyltransferase involved in cell wall biosynthesis